MKYDIHVMVTNMSIHYVVKSRTHTSDQNYIVPPKKRMVGKATLMSGKQPHSNL